MNAQSARDNEAAMVARCHAVGSGLTRSAANALEANVFRVAAMVLGNEAVASRLARASDEYFATHLAEQLSDAEVIHRGWVTSLPRLRQLLEDRIAE